MLGGIGDKTPEVGIVIAGKYRVTSLLGSGGMSRVVKAEHLLMRKAVAIKFLHGADEKTTKAAGRLFREARATQALSSEHVVRVFDLGVHEDAPYIVMELLEGADLAALVAAKGPLSVDAAVDVVLEACVAVAEAHAQHIFHRDIKPANLFAARTGAKELVKVLDFGISKVPVDETEDCEQTSSDAMLGTPYYMSPEQLRNPSNVDGRTDIWALGVTLWFLLTGAHPFRGANRREVMASVLTDRPADLRAVRSDLPEGLARVIAATLEKRADDRTPSIYALAQALAPFAGARGRLAAERIHPVETPKAALSGDGGRATVTTVTTDSLATTDDGLSSTLRPAPATRPREEPRKRSARLPIVVFAIALGAVAIVWAWPRPERSAGSPRVDGASAQTVTAEAVSVAAAPLASTVAPEPSPSSRASERDPLQRSLVVPPPQPKGARLSAPLPAAKPSASPSARPPRVDIDGVPILE